MLGRPSVQCFFHGESLAVEKKSAKLKCRLHDVVRLGSGPSFILGGTGSKRVPVHRPYLRSICVGRKRFYSILQKENSIEGKTLIIWFSSVSPSPATMPDQQSCNTIFK